MIIERRKITNKDKINYQKYLLSKKWKEFRERAFEFYGKECGKCGNKHKLEIHHRTYRNIYHETLSSVSIATSTLIN